MGNSLQLMVQFQLLHPHQELQHQLHLKLVLQPQETVFVNVQFSLVKSSELMMNMFSTPLSMITSSTSPLTSTSLISISSSLISTSSMTSLISGTGSSASYNL